MLPSWSSSCPDINLESSCALNAEYTPPFFWTNLRLSQTALLSTPSLSEDLIPTLQQFAETYEQKSQPKSFAIAWMNWSSEAFNSLRLLAVVERRVRR